MRYFSPVLILSFALFVGGCESVAVRTEFPPRHPESYPPPPPGSEGVSVTYGSAGVYPVALHIPKGHLPPPGSCRIWYPDRPPGHQPPPGDCGILAHRVPAGAWLISRSRQEQKYLRVSVYDQARPGIVLVIRVFESATGRFVREESP